MPFHSDGPQPKVAKLESVGILFFATLPALREAAAVDGELVDIIGNFNVVRAFGATFREQRRIDERMGTEMAARRLRSV